MEIKDNGTLPFLSVVVRCDNCFNINHIAYWKDQKIEVKKAFPEIQLRKVISTKNKTKFEVDNIVSWDMITSMVETNCLILLETMFDFGIVWYYNGDSKYA